MGANGTFHVFSDASASTEGDLHGLGIIALDPAGFLYQAVSKTISYGGHNSVRLEFLAATHGISLIPEGSKLELHFDYNGIQNRYRQKNSGTLCITNFEIGDVCLSFFNEISRHSQITLTQAQQREFGYIEAAHFFANAAAGRSDKLVSYQAKLQRALRKNNDLGKREKKRISVILEAVNHIHNSTTLSAAVA